MSRMIDRLLSVAVAEVGYLEKATNRQLDDKTANAGNANFTKYARDMFEGNYQGQPWCAVFISWVAARAGISEDIFYPHAFCPYGVEWYKARGLWRPRAGYTPKPGDIIYFTSNGLSASHVGMVERVDGSRVHTIEGNTSGGSTLVANGGCVARKSYALNYSKILGYAVPKYEEDVMEKSKVMVGGVEVPSYLIENRNYADVRSFVDAVNRLIGLTVSWSPESGAVVQAGEKEIE